MKIDMKYSVSLTEANKNFSRIAKMVDEKGSAVIMKNSKPKYVIFPYDQLSSLGKSDKEEMNDLAKLLLTEHKKAFQED